MFNCRTYWNNIEICRERLGFTQADFSCYLNFYKNSYNLLKQTKPNSYFSSAFNTCCRLGMTLEESIKEGFNPTWPIWELLDNCVDTKQKKNLVSSRDNVFFLIRNKIYLYSFFDGLKSTKNSFIGDSILYFMTFNKIKTFGFFSYLFNEFLSNSFLVAYINVVPNYTEINTLFSSFSLLDGNKFFLDYLETKRGSIQKKEFAHSIGLTDSQYVKYINHYKRVEKLTTNIPLTNKIFDISEKLNVSVDEIFGDFYKKAQKWNNETVPTKESLNDLLNDSPLIQRLFQILSFIQESEADGKIQKGFCDKVKSQILEFSHD